MGKFGKRKSISEGVRIVATDIRNRHIRPHDFEVSDNWPIMMAIPELNDIYEHSEERIKDIEDSVRVEIDRPALNRITFDRVHNRYVPEPEPLKQQILNKCQCSKKCLQEKLCNIFPFLQSVHKYNFKEYLLKDLIAGLSVGLVDIPQSMGFALMAGVPPIYGLYSSFFPVLFYFFFGQSRHVTVGTMAIISIMIRNVVDREADRFLHNRSRTQDQGGINELPSNSTTEEAWMIPANTTEGYTDRETGNEQLELHNAAIASAVTLLSCLIMLVMGLSRLGVVKKLMPTSFISGFTTGAAFHIGTSQIPAMLGIKIAKHTGAFKLPYLWADICGHLPKTNIATLVITIGVLFILIIFKEVLNMKLRKKLPFPIPVEVIILIFVTGFSYAFHFNQEWDVQVIGKIPRGIPAPSAPPLTRAPSFIADAFIIAILSFVITISMADIFARKYHYTIDTNHELISNALSYGISSLFHCFMGAAAPPRCFIQESCGGKTKVASLFTFSVLLVVILFLGPLFESLPRTVLACIIFVAIFPLFKQFKMVLILWKVSKVDLSIWLVTWSTVTFLDVPIGLGIGIAWSLLTMPLIAMLDSGFQLGRTPFQDIYIPLATYKLVSSTGDIVIFRYENALFFATLEKFKEGLFRLAYNPAHHHHPKAPKQHKHNSLVIKNKGILEKSRHSHNNDKSAGSHQVVTARAPGKQALKTVGEPSVMGDGEMGYKTEDEPIRPILAIILDCSAMTYVDLMGLMTLKQLSHDYRHQGTRLMLTGCTKTLLDKLESDGQIRGPKGDKLFVFPTIQDAVLLVNMIRLSKKEKVRKISII